MANELKDTLMVDNLEYNINAVEANHVKNPLILNKLDLDGKRSKLLSFDGSTGFSVDIIPASGGRFTGPIAVPKNTDTTIKDETILNYGDIKDEIVNQIINNSVLYTWENNVLNIGTVDNAIAGMSLVRGKEADVNSFATKNNKNSTDNPDNSNAAKRWLAAYLYVCKDTNNIYYGISDKTTAIRLAEDAKTVKEVVVRNNKSVTVDYSATEIETIENNVLDIIDGTIPAGNAILATYAAEAAALDCSYTANGVEYVKKLTGKAVNDTLETLKTATINNKTVIQANETAISKNTQAIDKNATKIAENTQKIANIEDELQSQKKIFTQKDEPKTGVKLYDIWIKLPS